VAWFALARTRLGVIPVILGAAAVGALLRLAA
jgi:hypothetical protein